MYSRRRIVVALYLIVLFFEPPGEMETGSNIAKRAQKTQGYINSV